MKTKNLIVGAAVVSLAAWLGACGTPIAHCLTVGSPSGSGYAYWMKYLNSDSSSACSGMKGENIGFQVYNTPRTNDFSLAWRVDGIGLPIANGQTSTEIDDQVNAGNCAIGVCSSVENPKANGTATMPSFPTNGICEMSNFVGAEQHFDAVPPGMLPDGGPDPMMPGSPATHIAYNFTKLRFASTTNAPGTAFDGELDFTQDSCTFHYKVFGFWPAIACATDLDCAPAADVDAGHVLGSGINPTFQQDGKPIVCNKDVGICELAFTNIDDINAIK